MRISALQLAALADRFFPHLLHVGKPEFSISHRRAAVLDMIAAKFGFVEVIA